MVRMLGGGERQGAAPTRRRRSYTAEQKRELVEATKQPGASVSAVAQRHNVNANLLFTWRRQMRDVEAAAAGATPGPTQFIPLGVIGGDAAESVEARSTTRLERRKQRRGSCRIEIELPNGVQLRVDEAVEVETLRQVIAALKGAW